MSFPLKFLARILLNAGALWASSLFLSGFSIPQNVKYLLFGGLVLALLNTFLRPVIKLFTFPFIFLSFGLFNVVINLALLWLADAFLTQLTITGFLTLFLSSIIIGIANSIL